MMLQFWFNLRLEWQIAFVTVIGFFLGPCLNWTIYNLAYFPRPISPWKRSRFAVSMKNDDSLTKLIDNTSRLGPMHLPILGWLFLRNEATIHGRLFWLRPSCIELAFPVFLGWFFWYEVTGGLLPSLALPRLADLQPALHSQFMAHAILCLFMCAATFIDFDERTIPDFITIPGTLIGLVGSACFPAWHLWIAWTDPITNTWPSILHYDSPWSSSSIANSKALLVGLLCFAIWCFGLADRRLILRRGLRKAVVYFLAGLVRYPTWKYLIAIWISGSVAIAVAWAMLSHPGQQSLLSSLVGMVLGGLTVWSVRSVAGLAIGVEALGFGDVTLMAMVGTYVGWQPTAIAFFLSPMIALLFVLIRYLLTGDNQTPFGPYLCIGVLVTMLFWNDIWNHYFQDMLLVMGPILAQLLLVALILMGGLLWVWRLIKELIFARPS